MPLKIAIIGAGHMGKIHLQKLLAIEDAQVVAIADTDETLAGNITEKYSIPFFSDYTKTLNNLNGVVIASSTETHYEIAKFFLENNIHVFIEKPITSDTADASDLVKLADIKNLILQIGHLERFNPAYKNAVPFVQNPLFIEARRTSNFTGRSPNIDVVLDLMIHDIDLVLSIAKNDVKDVRAQGVSFVGDTLDMVNTTIEFMNGCVANLFASRIAAQRERVISIFETDRNVYIDLLNGKYLCNIKNMNGNIETTEHVSEKIDSVMDELSEFISSIKGGKTPSVTGKDGLKALILADRIKENIV
ncbi:MAG: Gfo/Idh/MocA family oxidoreductase [Proteobacteria bacterium]|nr:Gfo/Idh/MocA family oxidoreductase [Pseudomonadota bacterium]